MAACLLISYLRVSTDAQGEYGLGVAAQREAVTRYQRQSGCELVAEYREVESGRRSDRPALAKALDHAERIGATVVFAKLDRLARDVHFLTGLLKRKATLVFCDLPDLPPGPVSTFVLHMMASVAQLEAGLIGQRTKAALAAKRERGERWNTERHPNSKAAAAAALSAKADTFAAGLRDKVTSLRAGGITSATGLAKALNRRGITTPRGKRWTTTAAQHLIARLDHAGSPS